MYLSKDKKREIFSNFGGDAGNTGSTEGQIALKRITRILIQKDLLLNW